MNTTEHQAPGFAALGADYQPQTPHPWIYNPNCGRVTSEAGTLLAVLQPGGDGGPVLTPAEMHANGRVMAAAPELLAALRRMEQFLACAYNPNPEDDPILSVTRGEAQWCVNQARAAIFAATGQPEQQ